MKTVILKENDILELREKIKPYLTEKRYAHTLSVEREADLIGELFLPDDRLRLRAAALLHDITKKVDHEKQLQYCSEFGIIQSNMCDISGEVLHALTGAAFSEQNFGEYVDDDILSGIRSHTTGRRDMTVFESIIYLADFIEETRTFEGCRALRSFFWDRIECGENKYDVLRDTMIRSFDMTMSHLIEKGSVIDLNTVEARNSFIVRDLCPTSEVLT